MFESLSNINRLLSIFRGRASFRSFAYSNSLRVLRADSGTVFHFIISSMKTVQQLQEEIYQQALTSGYFKNMQAQLKSYVFDLIEKQYGSRAKGFQYEHPLLQKLRQYPLTSLCLDLIQEFLESFKFKHTLNVFKKQINRTHNISRGALAEQFRIQIRNPEAQAVLVSMVTQMVSGEVGAVREPMRNNFMEKKQPDQPIRNNYFMGETQKPLINTQATAKQKVPIPPLIERPTNQNSSISSSSLNPPSGSKDISNSANSVGESKIDSSSSKLPGSVQASMNSNINMSAKEESQQKIEKEDKKGKNAKEDKKKKKVQKEKPPEGATDLLGDVMKKFESISKVNKQEEKKSLFDSKRAFSEEKEKKVTDPSESGANKIRGISAGKGMSSLMNKFMPQAFQQPKNESYVDEELDEFQQSKDSTRRNPLFSSSESGFDKSGFDYSVDSNSIDQYQYSQRARKVFKKF